MLFLTVKLQVKRIQQMRSAPALKNMFLDCIRKIIPANCTHILQKAFFKHALVYYSLRRKKSIYFFLM